MNRYQITYTEGADRETLTCVFRGYNAEHAETRFLDSLEEEGGNEGVIVLSVRKLEPLAKAVSRFFA